MEHTDLELEAYLTDVLGDLLVDGTENLSIAADMDNVAEPSADIIASLDQDRADDVLTPLTTAYIDIEPFEGKTWGPKPYRYLVPSPDRKPEDVLMLNEHVSDTHKPFIVHNETTRTYLAFDDYAHYKLWFGSSGLRTLHEVIIGAQPQKLKFDIDASVEKIDAIPGNASRTQKSAVLFGDILDTIKFCFECVYDHELADSDITISDSTDATKFSRHIVISSYHVADSANAEEFTRILLSTYMPPHIRELGVIDAGVNKSKQNFRLPGCHKVGSTRVKRCIQGTPDDMIITLVGDTRPLPALDIPGRPQNTDHVETTASNAAIVAMASDHTDGHEFDRRDGNRFLFKRVAPSYCRMCDRVHDKDNTLFVTVWRGIVTARCRRKKDASERIGTVDDERVTATDQTRPERNHGDSIKPRERNLRAEIPKQFDIEEYCEPHLRPYDFHDGKYDTLMIRSNMGTGKTKQLIDTIAALPPTTAVIFVSFRKSFTAEIMGKLGPGFVNYDQVSGQITSERVVIQYESLDRLKLPVGRRVMLVLDEIESVVSQIKSVCGDMKKRRDCWVHWQWLLQNATQLIAMDALAGQRAYNRLLCRRAVCVHLNTWKPAAEAAPIDRYAENYETFLAAIKAAALVAADEPFVVAATSRTKAEALYLIVLELYPHPERIRFYSAASTKNERAELRDVNTAWAGIDVLIYTSTITAGCSFELPRFKRRFAYFTSRSCDALTAVQMMGRVRDIATRENLIFIKTGCENLPSTRREIERAMATKIYLCNIETNPLDRPLMVNAIGEYEYEHKDEYYHTIVDNMIVAIRSRNWFHSVFHQYRAEMGAVLFVEKAELDKDTSKALLDESKNACDAVLAEAIQLVANARSIDYDEAQALANQRLLTREDRAALDAHRLEQCYGVGPDSITPDFVEKYGKKETRTAYWNLRRLCPEMSIEDAIKDWRAGNVLAGNSIDDLNEPESMVQCMFAVDVINKLMVMPAENEFCREFRSFRTWAFKRQAIEARIDGVLEYLRGHVETVSLLFNIRRDRLLAHRSELKAKIELVNSILKKAFAVKLVGRGKKGHPAKNFKLTEPKGFKWHNERGRYEVDI